MAATNARERVLGALRRQRASPVPVGAVTQSATLAQMESTGVRWPAAHADARLMAALAESAHSILGFDMVRVPFDQTIEAELLGARVDPGDAASNCSIRSHPLSLGDPVPPMPGLDSGRPRIVLDAIALLRRRLDGHAAVIGGLVGPFTVVSQLAGAAQVLMAALRTPHVLKPYLDFAVALGAEYGRRQVAAGADAICIEDMGASLDLTSPVIYRNLIAPAQADLIAAIGAPVILHVCGSNARILDLMATTGAEALSLEARSDLAKAAGFGTCAVIGGIDPVAVLLNGTPGDVRRAALDCLDAGVNILAPGCGLPARTPTDNLLEMVRAAREWNN